jgi:general secretion pathway protein B
MSSILKALQKLEKDKVSRKPETLKINAEILRGKPSRKLSFAGTVFAALLLFICGSGAMYLFMKRPATTASIPATATVKNTPVQEDTTVVVVQPPDSQEQVVQAVSIQAEKINDTRQPISNKAEQTQKKTEAVVVNITPVLEQRATEIHKTPPEVLQQNRRMPHQATPATPNLTVNGIAFQDGAAENIAVVNGVSVSKGSVVEGVTVEAILKDRVIFKIGKELVEVNLGKSSK